MLQTMSIIIPGTIDRDNEITSDHHNSIVREVMNRATRRCGGCSAFPGIGSFRSASGAIIRERITRIDIGYNARESGHEDWLRDIARELAESLNQESVTVIIDGSMEFVGPELDTVESDPEGIDRPASRAFGIY